MPTRRRKRRLCATNHCQEFVEYPRFRCERHEADYWEQQKREERAVDALHTGRGVVDQRLLEPRELVDEFGELRDVWHTLCAFVTSGDSLDPSPAVARSDYMTGWCVSIAVRAMKLMERSKEATHESEKAMVAVELQLLVQDRKRLAVELDKARREDWAWIEEHDPVGASLRRAMAAALRPD